MIISNYTSAGVWCCAVFSVTEAHIGYMKRDEGGGHRKTIKCLNKCSLKMKLIRGKTNQQKALVTANTDLAVLHTRHL